MATSLLAASGCAISDSGGDDTAAASETQAAQAVTLNDRITACNNDPRVAVGKLSADTCVGADLFFRETFNGNGRSCGTCHRVDHNMVMDAQFMTSLGANDPLFIAEFNPTLSQLEVPTMMRQFGLILENVDGFAPDPRSNFVLRAVPHTLSMSTSIATPAGAPNPPANRTGWGGDGAPGNGALRDFQTGAITQHYTKSLSRTVGTDFRLATDTELDKIDTFMRQLGRTNELDLNTVTIADANAEAGRQRFLTVGCNACHGNAGANATFATGGNRNFNTGVESMRNSTLAGFPHDGGFGTAAQASGAFGDGTFNAPPLIEAADTGPFFHTMTTVTGASAHNVDVATTIEEAVAFYDSQGFANSPSGQVAPINMTAQEIDNIARFLRVLNATFNVAQALKRLDAAQAVTTRFGDQTGTTNSQFQLMRLAALDIQDAINDLTPVGLFPTQVTSLNQAFTTLRNGLSATTASARLTAETSAAQTAAAAAAAMGTNMNYQIGDGTVAF
ncbi:MAG TPA: hypothetical protein VFP84_26090 [Kofleriaceae bacterium]|nr:hypothetical protein [Kofleriaceae bacterium]